MKPVTSYTKHRAKITLATCLAALFAVATVPVRAQAAADQSAPSLDTDEGVETLGAFEVSEDKDYGYLKTNSATATRIGMEIQKVPLNISVISRDFLDDTNARSLTDIFRYTAAASGDNRFAMRRPANEATPQGAFTLRGFAVNVLMRNGVFRYISYNLDNVERVEIVKGPASVFFGQGYPGGVINYITKRPQFSKIPTTFSYQLNDNSGQKLVIDHNAVLSKNAAFRVVGAWEDTQGERRYEFRKNINITPSLTMIPFESGKVKVNLEMEYLEESFNQNDYDWIWSDFAGWNSTNGTVGSSRYTNYGAYFADKRVANGTPGAPAYTKVEKGAYYTDASGTLTKDESFNYTSRGAKTMNEVEIFSATVDFNPFDWMSGRYVYQRDHSVYNSIEGITTPYADGQYWSTNGSATAGYYRETEMHTVDLIFSYDIFGVKNKILTGYTRSNWTQQYNSNDPAIGRWYGHVPGINNAIANPGGAAATLGGSGGQVPSGAVVRERDGTIKTPSQVYTRFDPGFDIYPDISQIFPADRSVLDGYKTSLSAAYINWQANLLDERLDLIAGFRRETKKNLGQHAIPTYPWVITPWNAYQDTVQYPTSAYGYGPGYQNGEVGEQEGDSWMGGASFAVTKEINVYASVSKTFKFNSGVRSGADEYSARAVYQSALNHGGGSYVYKGQTITSVQAAIDAHNALGAFTPINNEEGKNIEFGAKITTADNKIVGTVSFFRGERVDERIDDGARQSNAEEPYNSSTTLFGVGTVGYNTRNFRWRTTNLKNRIEGAEAEVVWTPMRNYQAVINGSWLWTARTVYD